MSLRRVAAVAAAAVLLSVAVQPVAAVRQIPELLPIEATDFKGEPHVDVPDGLSPFAATSYKMEKFGGLLSDLKNKIEQFEAEKKEKEGAVDAAYNKAQTLYDAYVVAYREYLNTPSETRSPDNLISLAKQLAEAQNAHFDATSGYLKESGDLKTDRLALDMDVSAVQNAVGRQVRGIADMSLRLKK